MLKQKPQDPTENVKGITNGKSPKFILPLPVSLRHPFLLTNDLLFRQEEAGRSKRGPSRNIGLLSGRSR
jgi:hypothetical protein